MAPSEKDALGKNVHVVCLIQIIVVQHFNLGKGCMFNNKECLGERPLLKHGRHGGQGEGKRDLLSHCFFVYATMTSYDRGVWAHAHHFCFVTLWHLCSDVYRKFAQAS